mmetsp:Transcript_43527/g.102257  ORF Transcript_43527/g.102257 Transcript_43527/m.102257 type:complete len:236 (-) Transcript_43527:28-735(-)|eukprot:3194605-Rhodomonas_salina.2
MMKLFGTRSAMKQEVSQIKATDLLDAQEEKADQDSRKRLITSVNTASDSSLLSNADTETPPKHSRRGDESVPEHVQKWNQVSAALARLIPLNIKPATDFKVGAIPLEVSGEGQEHTTSPPTPGSVDGPTDDGDVSAATRSEGPVNEPWPLSGAMEGMGKVGKDVLAGVGEVGERFGSVGGKLLDIFDLHDIGGDFVEMKDRVESEVKENMDRRRREEEERQCASRTASDERTFDY